MPGPQQKHERHLKCVPGALGCGGIHPPKQGEAGVRPVPAPFFPRDPAVLAADVPGHLLCCVGTGEKTTFEAGYAFFQNRIREEQVTFIYQCGKHRVPLEDILALVG